MELEGGTIVVGTTVGGTIVGGTTVVGTTVVSTIVKIDKYGSLDVENHNNKII